MGRICDPWLSSGAVCEGCSCWEMSLTTRAFWERAAFKGIRISDLERWPTIQVDVPRATQPVWAPGDLNLGAWVLTQSQWLLSPLHHTQGEQGNQEEWEERFWGKTDVCPCPAGLCGPDLDSHWGHLYRDWPFFFNLTAGKASAHP